MSNNIHSVKLSSFETPEVIEDNREDWVEFGKNNDFFNFILDRYKGSTTNATIINNTSKLVYGRGLSSVDASRKPNEYATMKALFSKKTLKALTLDYKMLGNCALQIIYSKDRKKVKEVHHIPVNLLRPEKCNSEGVIEAYYFCNDWSDTKKFVPERISAFGQSKSPIEIYYIKPYSVDMKYFGLPDYFSSIPYARLEEDISKYLISEVNSSFASRTLVNLNNGIPDEASQFEIKNKIVSSLTGTDGQKVIVAFNNGQENATTIESLAVADAPDLYNSLSLECEKKILVGHNITSPLMFGISSKNGFSSNSEELTNSYVLYNNMYILPVQDVLTDAFEEILSYNDIALELFFKTLKPLEFTDKEDRGQEKEKEEEETKLSSQKKAEDDLVESLEGGVMSDEFELVDSREFNNDNESLEDWIEATEKKDKKSLLEKLSSVVKSRPSAKSQLDKSIYKVRYKYNAKYNKPESRNFCKQMMTRSANGVVYRLEDIDKATREMNFKSAGLPMHNGQNFDLFKFKGGLNCSHFWSEELYKRKKNKDGSYKEDKALSSNEEVESIPKSYEPKPRGRQRAEKVESDRADKGHHPNYKR